jgi:serine/threonine-protein kinase
MPEQPLPETVHETRGDSSLDAGLAAAFDPDSAPLVAPRTDPLVLRAPPDNSPSAPHSDESPVGTAGRNLLFGEIARGGMGAVLRGRDPALGRELAVKVLLEAHRDKPELVRRFLEEAQIGGQLQHPGVVPVYELGRFDDDRPFFTMKLVKGQTLAELLKRRASAADELPHFLTIFGQICQTVAYAHAHGVIHRDLKPSNVMVGSFGEVQVMDWGMAKVLPQGNSSTTPDEDERTAIRTARSHSGADVSRPGAVMGTLAFMPPEQANGEVDQLDERADVFGLGAILCVILTGKPPYLGRDRDEVQRQAMRGELTDAFARLDGCGADAELIDLCKVCLSAAKQGRPRHAGVVAQQVAVYQAGVQERLRKAELERAAAQTRAVEERKRRRVVLALATAMLALVVGAAGSALWLQRKEADRKAEVVRRETELRQGVETDFQIVTTLLNQMRWTTARQVLARTRERLGETGPADLRERLEEVTTDLELAARLDAIRLERSKHVKGKLDPQPTDDAYAAAFRDAGLGRVGEDVDAVAARIRASAIKEQLVAALDDWALTRSYKTTAPDKLAWLLGVARRADSDDWRDRFRDPKVWRDRDALESLANELLQDPAKLQAHSPQLLTALGGVLWAREGNAVPLLTEARRRYPSDFWLNFHLGFISTNTQEWEEAIGYYRAALAVRPETAAVHFNLSHALLQKKQLDEAIKELRKAVAIDPKDATAHLNLGYALEDKGRLEEAIAEYHKALAIDPEDARAHNNLGAALEAKGRLDEAIVECQKALAIDPKLTEPHINLGNALKAKGQVDAAIAEYQKALAIDPKDAKAHNNLGYALRDKGQLDEAIAEFQKAIEIDPKFAAPHYNLGLALKDKRRLDEAIAEYQKAVAIDPKDAKAHYNLANTLQDKRRLDEAIAEYHKALAIDPKYVEAHVNLGTALEAKGRLDEAIAEYHKALEIDPKHALAHNNLGYALAAKGRLEEAIVEYQKALAIDPKHAKVHNNLGYALAAKGRRDAAIEEFQKAIDLDPKCANAHYNLGVALENKGRLDEAMEEFQKAIDLDPKNATAHTGLGNALSAKKQLDAAIAEYQKAIEIDPKFAAAHYNLGVALLTQGRFDEARTAARHCLELFPDRDPGKALANQLLQQCERLLALEAKLTTVLKGEAKPADAAERIALAQLCQKYKKLYAASARFYAETFDAKPELTKNPASGIRYNAACAAALAGCGEGKDDPKPDDKERVRLRQQSLDWLKADLALWSKQADSDKPKDREAVQQQMMHWQEDTDFAGVRDKDALAKLPEAERDAWRKLWDDVASVLKKVKEPK